jgi:hypothetical protein
MASASVSIGNLDQLLRLGNVNLTDEFEKAMDTSMQAGEQAMKEAIATRGTGKTWSHPWGRSGRTGSFPGRVDSGDMQNDAQGKVTQVQANYVEGVLGWDDNSPMYYALQDQGFTHVITNEDIEGMSALRDSAEVAERVLMQEIDGIVRRF